MTNTATLKVYDNYEISPCRRFEEPDSPGRFYFEVCEPAEADVWTLYGHIEGEGVEAIGDFASRKDAEEVYFRITGQPFTGSYHQATAPRILAALRAFIEADAIAEECHEWKWENLEHAFGLARDAVALVEATCPPSAPSVSPPANPARFEIEHNPAENSDRVYVLVDGKFDVAVIRTDEGVVVDVYPKDGFETVATTYAFDWDAEQESSTN